MKSTEPLIAKPFAIAGTEIRQNPFLSIVMLVVSLLVGGSAVTGFFVNRKINELSKPIEWGAEMAILPKGVTLSSFAETLGNGETPLLIPEALYDSTLAITGNALKLTAVLPADVEGEKFLMVKGTPIPALGWGKFKTRDWSPQTIYSTPEWGTKVAAAMFASGSRENLRKLKDLIDRKTIAQAYWIAESQRADIEKQEHLFNLALMIEIILSASLVTSIVLAASWLFQNHQSTRRCLKDIGLTDFELTKVWVSLAILLLVIPIAIGSVIAIQFH